MEKLVQLDSQKGAFSTMLLHHFGEKISRSQLIDALKQRGIGQSAAYKSIALLKELKLLYDETVYDGNKKFVYSYLSEKGDRILGLIYKINEELE
jgi:hypothetical protein